MIKLGNEIVASLFSVTFLGFLHTGCDVGLEQARHSVLERSSGGGSGHRKNHHSGWGWHAGQSAAGRKGQGSKDTAGR